MICLCITGGQPHLEKPTRFNCEVMCPPLRKPWEGKENEDGSEGEGKSFKLNWKGKKRWYEPKSASE